MIATPTKTDPQFVRLTFGLRRREGIKRRHRVVDPLQKELDVAGHVALSFIALLELVPFPDRFVVFERTQINSEFTHEVRTAHLVDVFTGYR